MEYPKFKVTVSCMTYNQSKYITDAMNGFTMQQTSFPFVCTIVDDASTDGEQEVISKYVEENFDLSEGSVAFQKETDYAHIIYAQHKTNKNCYFAVLFLKENHYSQKKSKKEYLEEWRGMCEYEALCEGDDYWIDSLKLQKQVDVLDNNSKISLVYTGFMCVDTNGKKVILSNWERYKSKSFSGDNYPSLFRENYIMTLTLCYRIFVACNSEERICHMLDYGLIFEMATRGDFFYLPEETSCYRINPNGSTLSNSALIKKNGETIYDYHAIQYLRHKFKKYSFYRDLQIKVYITLHVFYGVYFSPVSQFNTLCKVNRSMFVLYPLGIVYFLLLRFKSKFK